MYTKTLGPEKGTNIWIFFVLSIALHMAVALGLASFVPQHAIDVARRGAPPIVVDVIELPPMPDSTSAVRRPPSVYADRDQSVERETFPETSRPVPRPRPASPAAAPSGGGGSASSAPEAATRAAPPAEQAAAPEAEAETGAKDDFSLRAEPARPTVDKAAPVKPADLAAPPAAPATPSAATGPGAGVGASSGSSRPSLFPSGERLAELAREYESTSPQGERGKTLQLNTSELKYQKYLLNMKRRIELRWEYPAFAVRNGWQGILQLDFSLNSDGSVAEARVVRSSGYPVLDEAAVTAIRLAAPFPPFPEDFSVERININGRFEYLIYGMPPEGPVR